MAKATPALKRIGQGDITGALGVNIVERRVLEMGFLWYPSGGVEAGIDGRLEIRNEDAEVTNLIISVQSKATNGAFDGETDTEFTYTCTERDLRYWLRGNLPVILVCSRPKTDEAYWLSVKDYFFDPIRRASRKMRFVKAQPAFDQAAKDALRKLALPNDGGLYLDVTPKRETIFTDLVPVVSRLICSAFMDRAKRIESTRPTMRMSHIFIPLIGPRLL
jgi:hypothetical protein